jgi:ketosteroid isomerase-like protein
VSEENVKVVTGSFEHFNRHGHFPEWAYDPEVELENLPDSPLPGPYRGHDGLRQWREDIAEVLEDFQLEVEGVSDVDEGMAVVVRVRLRGTARHTGIPVDLPMTTVNWVRDGKIVRAQAFSDHGDALEAAAAGLPQ